MQRDEAKQHWVDEDAKHVETIYRDFINFCKQLDTTKILGCKVARSADEFIKKFKRTNPDQPYSQWFPCKKKTNDTLKSDDESKQLEKYNSIAIRPPKVLLRGLPGNYEIDTMIGKRNYKQALCTLIDIHNDPSIQLFIIERWKVLETSYKHW